MSRLSTIPAALLAHILGGTTRLATGLQIVRLDGDIFAFTSHDVDDSLSSITYTANPGLQASDIMISANASVGNLELTTLHDGTLFTTMDIFNGAWTNAAFTIFRYNWSNLVDGIDTLLVGTFGEAKIQLNTVVVELRDLRQYFQQNVGAASTRDCRYRLGSTDKNNGGLCLKDLTSFTTTSTITSAASNRQFTDSALAVADDFFGDGEISFSSGPNSGAGIRRKIKTYSSATKTFTLWLPFYGTVAAGQVYTAIAGCRKRRSEDCLTKFNNVLNFGGEPDRKGLDDLTQAAPAPNV